MVENYVDFLYCENKVCALSLTGPQMTLFFERVQAHTVGEDTVTTGTDIILNFLNS